MPSYTVKQGDCISSIADQTGFFWETLWNHGNNAGIRRRRKNPNALLPGDILFIPDKRKKEEACAPTTRHVFRIRGVPVRFNLRLVDESGKPRAGIPYVLEIDSKRTEGTVPADGNISEIIQPNAKKATLTLKPAGGGEEVYNFQLGHMNPADNIAGMQGRLKNLGYYRGDMTGSLDEDTSEAIRKFQANAGLSATGEADEATQAALANRHGG